jgi:hypothetical protein
MVPRPKEGLVTTTCYWPSVREDRGYPRKRPGSTPNPKFLKLCLMPGVWWFAGPGPLLVLCCIRLIF